MSTFARDLERRAQIAWFSLARWLGLSSREELSFIVLVPLVGIFTGFVAIGIYWLIDRVQDLAWGAPDPPQTLLERTQLMAAHAPWRNVLALLAAGAVVALIIKVFKQEVRGHGMSGIIEAVALKGGRVAPGPALVRELAGVVTVGSGGSLGREGPMIRTGAMLGSVIGQTGGIGGRRLKVLVAAGAAAGMAAAYNAPIGGAIFAMEVILGNFALEVFGPVVVASALATFVARAFRFHGPTYELVPAYSLHSVWELPAYLVLGMLAGPLSLFFSRGVRGGEWFFDRLDFIPRGIRPVVGMTAVGLLGIACPYVYGNGFDTVNLALQDPAAKLGLGLLVVLPFAKLLATSITLGSGCSGGLFTPALFFGGLLGGLFGLGVSAIMPEHAAAPGAYALGGMAAITAGTSHAPISSIIIIFELTGKYEAIIPLMVACMASSLIAKRLNKYSIYTEALARRGIELPSSLEEIVLETIQVREALHEDREFVRPAEPLAGLLERLRRARRTHLFVVDDKARYRGAVALYDLAPAFAEPGSFESVVAADLLDPGYRAILEDEKLSAALPVFARVEGEWLPVVSREGTYRGILGKQDVLALYAQEVLGHPAMLARISTSSGSSYVPLPHGFELRELAVRGALAGRSLLALELPQRHGIWVLAVIRVDESGRETRVLASASLVLREGDTLVALGSSEGFAAFARASNPPPASS